MVVGVSISNGFRDNYSVANVTQWLTTMQRSSPFILVPIDSSYTTSYKLSIVTLHRLATMHNVTDDRRTEHCSISTVD